ncbi:MAG: AfsA-related hotdog domain-containing protein [Propioniciclava sp.]
MSASNQELDTVARGGHERCELTLLEASVVHKTVPSEVLIGGYRQTGQGAHFGIILPPTHRTTPVGAAAPPAVLLLEVVRQLGIATAHLLLHVPADWVFIANSIQFAWAEDPVSFPSHGPIELMAEVEVTNIARRRGVVSRLTAHADIIDLEGFSVASASGTLSCIPASAYRAIRRNAHLRSSQHTRTDPAMLDVTRRDHEGLTASIGWDWRDRFQFDHDVDHIPGMVLAAAVVEAYKDLAGGSDPRRMSVLLHRYAELDTQPTLTAQFAGNGSRVGLTVTQDGNPVVTADLL